MAGIFSKFISAFTIFFIIISNVTVDGKSYRFSRSISSTEIGIKREKVSHLHFFLHDIVSGHNPTAVSVANATTNTSSTRFGLVVMIDDSLTEGPELTSKLVGRAQGIYAFDSQSEMSLLMSMNFAFIQGKYNGSTLSILGRNRVSLKVREMPVVGGSGLFRFARGYAQAKTRTLNVTTGDANVEYNVFVIHY